VAFATALAVPFVLEFWSKGALHWWFLPPALLLVLVAASGWWVLADQLWQAAKFGRAWLEYRGLPYLPGAPVDLLWWPPRGLRRIEGGAFTLRCDRIDQVGGGAKHSARLAPVRLWSGRIEFKRAMDLAPGQPLPLRFEPPAGLPASAPDADAPIEWTLDVALKVPGRDHASSYPVPMGPLPLTK
jgi:hypothetical protein